jgi:lipopolysaccharide export system permease protein
MAFVTILLALGYVVPIAGLDWAARSMYQDAILERMHTTSASGNALRGRGFWTVRHDTYVHVSEFDLTQQPKGIRVFEFDGDANLIRYLSARYADVLVSDQWQLHDVVEKTIATGEGIRTETFAERPWTPIWDPTIDMYELPDNSLSLQQLRSRINYQDNVNQSVTTLEVELWNRAALPISGLIFTLFAIPFALKPKPRGGMAGQIAIGSMFALLIYLGQQLGINAGVLAGLPPALAVALPALAVLAVGLLMMRRTT